MNLNREDTASCQAVKLSLSRHFPIIFPSSSHIYRILQVYAGPGTKLSAFHFSLSPITHDCIILSYYFLSGPYHGKRTRVSWREYTRSPAKTRRLSHTPPVINGVDAITDERNLERPTPTTRSFHSAPRNRQNDGLLGLAAPVSLKKRASPTMRAELGISCGADENRSSGDRSIKAIFASAVENTSQCQQWWLADRCQCRLPARSYRLNSGRRRRFHLHSALNLLRRAQWR
ncbi:hypothetical protein B0H66DRAFT_106530 [Apodospora peruviana]|uniref:Uncharacterized protein n=1 Tax=Apodospora peruviana TaxID=516989 RepID=A0AAE0IGU5_9PEZI|nr:hypothetical protein B0H66DRAFT_106530 [Apodospora peruviana]